MAEDQGTAGSLRAKSTIKFPYSSLMEAIKVAEAVHNQHGGRCATDQLAASLGHVLDSGTFRVKLYAASTFGLIRVKQGQVMLLPLGESIINPETAGRAKVDAFLTVPLYKRVYDNYRGKLLPRDEGLENFLVSVGVAEKQADKARRAMQNSAATAGMFASGKNRLVIPPGLGAAPLAEEGPEDEGVPNDEAASLNAEAHQDQGYGKLPDSAKHPLIYGLLTELPAHGQAFPLDARETWLEMAKLSFNLIYGKVDRPSLSTPRSHESS